MSHFRKRRTGVVAEKYLWSGLTGLLAVYDDLDNLVARFEYADGPLPVKMVSRTGQGYATYYLAYDQVGSLRAVINDTGGIAHAIRYDSFGNITDEPELEVSGLATLPFGFAGGLHDRDTGLVHFGFRDYDPETGRWTAKDPIGFAAGDVNIYGYCFNNPVSLFDPFGLGAASRVQAALGHKGDTDWAVDAGSIFPWDPWGPNSNKCNKFVADVITEAGDTVPYVNGRLRKYPPTAGQWGDPNFEIPGWIVVENPMPGDVASIPAIGPLPPGSATGHVGIVIENNPEFWTTASASDKVVLVNDWAGRPGQKPVFRRPIDEAYPEITKKRMRIPIRPHPSTFHGK